MKVNAKEAWGFYDGMEMEAKEAWDFCLGFGCSVNILPNSTLFG
jgi:hypothetical protein